MNYFSGLYETKLDAKGRVSLPSRLKIALPESEIQEIVLFMGFEKCLEIYDKYEWDKKIAEILKLNTNEEKVRHFIRNFSSRSINVELDSAGRFVIPKLWLQYANLESDILLLGALNKIELWQPSEYQKVAISDPIDLSILAENLLSTKIDAK